MSLRFIIISKKLKIFRYLTLTILSIFSLLLIGALVPKKWSYSPQSCKIKICVANFDIHTEIIVPVTNKIYDWRKHLPLNTNYKYLAFGWGEREFYMNAPDRFDLKSSAGLRALFLPNPSVIRVEGYRYLPKKAEIKCFGVSQQGYLNLSKFIDDTFQVNKQGGKIRLRYGIPPNVSYYEAKGTYSVLRTCNSWTAEGLEKADVNTPRWAGLSSAIMLHLDNSCDGGK